MSMLNLTADQVLTTTRAVRKRLDFDRPVEASVIDECLDIALQAPTGSNAQGWHFVVVTEQDKKDKIAALYQQTFADYAAGPAQPTKLHADDPSMAHTQEKVLSSAQYLADNMSRVPVLLIPCCSGRIDTPGLPAGAISGMLGSIYPAIWSFMLAARERSLGTCLTTLHLNHEAEIAELLGIPDDISQIALIPVAYTKGTDFKLAPRKELGTVVHRNSW